MLKDHLLSQWSPRFLGSTQRFWLKSSEVGHENLLFHHSPTSDDVDVINVLCRIQIKQNIFFYHLYCSFLLHFLYPFSLRTERFPTFYKIKSSCTPLSLSVQSLSCVLLFGTPWTLAHQVPLSMAFSRQEYRSGVPLPSPLTALEYYFFSSDWAVILTFQISQVMPSWLLLNSLTVIISTSRFILYPSLNYSINERIIRLYVCIYI